MGPFKRWNQRGCPVEIRISSFLPIKWTEEYGLYLWANGLPNCQVTWQYYVIYTAKFFSTTFEPVYISPLRIEVPIDLYLCQRLILWKNNTTKKTNRQTIPLPRPQTHKSQSMGSKWYRNIKMVSQDDLNSYFQFSCEVELCLCLLAVHISFHIISPLIVFLILPLFCLTSYWFIKDLKKKSEYKSKVPYTCGKSLSFVFFSCLSPCTAF